MKRRILRFASAAALALAAAAVLAAKPWTWQALDLNRIVSPAQMTIVYDRDGEPAAEMGGVCEESYRPDPAAHAVYDRLYAEYGALHDLFGRGGSDVMKRLREIKRDAR